MYAQLCKRLSDSVSQFDGGHQSKGEEDDDDDQAQQQPQQTFLDVLSKVCWEKFENRFRYYSQGPQVVNGQETVLTADEEERQHVVKQKMLGNLKFIGELYLLGQLDDPIIHNCILQLLGNDKVSADLQVRCQDLECLCQLIRTCGKSLDAGPGGNLMDQYFNKMVKDSLKHQVYPPRIRFMLRDVIDLREDRWVPRTAIATQPGPMPIHLLRGSAKEDDDREAASAEHHHRMLSRGGDHFGTGSPSHGGRDDHRGGGSLYGGRGSGGRDPMRGGDNMLSSTDLFMSKIPGFNDMFNSLSMGATSTSSLLPPPPLMHNNRYLRDNNNGKSSDGGDREYRGSGHDRRGGERRDRDEYFHRGSGGGGGERENKGGGYRNNNNNNNNNNGNYGGRDGNQYGGRGSNNYRDQQQQQNSSGDRPNNQYRDNNRPGDREHENEQRGGGGGGGRNEEQGGNNNGYSGGHSSRERDNAGGGQRDRDGGNNEGGAGRNNNYYNNRSNSPYNNNNNGGGGGGNSNRGENSREFNRDRDNYMNGGSYNNNNGQQQQQQGGNFHRNNNRNNSYNQNGGAAGGNFQNNRFSKNQNGAAMNGQQGMYEKKDLAPRFKRTMMGSGGPGGVGGQHGGVPRDNYHNAAGPHGSPGGGGQSGNNNSNNHNSSSSNSAPNNNTMSSSSSSASSATGETAAPGVDNLQMRPAANSLLFKANTMNVNKLPLSQPQQRVIPTNSMMAAQQQQQQQQQQERTQNGASQQYQGRDSNNSPFKGPASTSMMKKDGVSPISRAGVGGLREQQQDLAAKAAEAKKGGEKEQQQQKETPQSTVAGGEKSNKKKKDKGPSKEEVLKKFASFLEETYFQRWVAVDPKEDENGEKKNQVDQVESEKEVVAVEQQVATEATGEDEKTDEVESPTEDAVAPAPIEAENVAAAVEEQKPAEIIATEVTVEKEAAPKQPVVAQEQPLEEIVQKYLDLKVPDKFVKDCLASLYAVSMEREMAAQDTPKSLNEVFLKANAEAYCGKWWDLSFVERCVVFVDSVKGHVKMGNNGTESIKQTVLSVAADTPKQMPWLTKLLATSVLVGVYGLAELAALTDNGKLYPLMLDTLQRLTEQEETKKRLGELFQAAKVDLLQVLPETDRNKDRLVAVLDERGLDFLCPLLKVQSLMWKQIQVDSNPQQLYKWIKENVDVAYFVEEGFIQALVTVLLKQITQETTLPEGADQTKNPDKALIEKEKQTLQKYSAVLHAFLNNVKMQLIAIYALQVYCHSVDFPKGMLLRWFTALYDLNVIEEEAFLQWKEDLSEAYPGKQRALFQVNAWLMWLQEAESEEEEEN